MLFDPLTVVRATGKYFRLAAQGGIHSLTLELTRRCNAKCDMCDHWREPKQFELEDFTPIVQRFDPLAVILCGGEPLLRKDLARQVYALRQLPGWRFLGLITNGGQLSVERGLELVGAGLDQINVSLDYPDARHDEERHLPGLFEHLTQVVPALTRAGVHVELNTVILRENLDDLMPLAELARRWGATITYTLFSALPAQNPAHALTPADSPRLLEIVEALCAFRKAHGVVRSSSYYLRRCVTFTAGVRFPGCRAGRRMIHVSPGGFVRPCALLPPAEHYSRYEPARRPPVACDACWMACRAELEAPITINRVRELLV
ncbi:MAG TPA: radical SAM protein [Polyangia bacterium]|jgi:MoaA/NifB/PqqE/SkfB family radical SAM enzyme